MTFLGHRIDVRAAGDEEGYDILVAFARGCMDRPETVIMAGLGATVRDDGSTKTRNPKP